MKKIRLRKNTMIAGGFCPMGSEAEVPDEIAAHLRYAGHCEILADVEEPKPRKSRKSRKTAKKSEE